MYKQSVCIQSYKRQNLNFSHLVDQKMQYPDSSTFQMPMIQIIRAFKCVRSPVFLLKQSCAIFSLTPPSEKIYFQFVASKTLNLKSTHCLEEYKCRHWLTYCQSFKHNLLKSNLMLKLLLLNCPVLLIRLVLKTPFPFFTLAMDGFIKGLIFWVRADA